MLRRGDPRLSQWPKFYMTSVQTNPMYEFLDKMYWEVLLEILERNIFEKMGRN
jgi:hypothetical protein